MERNNMTDSIDCANLEINERKDKGFGSTSK